MKSTWRRRFGLTALPLAAWLAAGSAAAEELRAVRDPDPVRGIYDLVVLRPFDLATLAVSLPRHPRHRRKGLRARSVHRPARAAGVAPPARRALNAASNASVASAPAPVTVQQRVRGAIARRCRVPLALELRCDAGCQRLAELHAPLVELIFQIAPCTKTLCS